MQQDNPSPVWSSQDMGYMQEALTLAKRGLYSTRPNPRVGAVLADEEGILGAGWHHTAGGPHAEVVAISAAKKHYGADRISRATLYVTLEPCCHFGRTPPCTDLIIQSRIGKVVLAMQDPNPQVAGKGIAILQAANIQVLQSLLATEAMDLNPGFISRMQYGIPWVRMKIAASLDGRTSLADGQSQWITGPSARFDGHAFRARAGAILTGLGTIQADNPSLTARHPDAVFQPLRVIVDSQMACPHTARLFTQKTPVLIAAAVDSPSARKALESAGAEVLILPSEEGKVQLPALLRELARRQIDEVHVEAGFKLNGSLLRAGCVNELLLYYGQCLLGEGAVGLCNIPSPPSLGKAEVARIVSAQLLPGGDLRVQAILKTHKLQEFEIT